METKLSETAEALLRLHLGGGSLQVGDKAPQSLDGHTVEKTRAAYRELARAGLMEVLHSFAWGRESRYRITEMGWMRRFEFIDPASLDVSPAGSTAPRR